MCVKRKRRKKGKIHDKIKGMVEKDVYIGKKIEDLEIYEVLPKDVGNDKVESVARTSTGQSISGAVFHQIHRRDRVFKVRRIPFLTLLEELLNVSWVGANTNDEIAAFPNKKWS
jgi:hypothetical protein